MTDETTNSDDAEALLFGRARRGLAPTAADKRRMMGRLSAAFAQLGEPSLIDGFGSGGAASGPPSAARLYSLKLLVGSVLAGTALGFASGVLVTEPKAEQEVLQEVPSEMAGLDPQVDEGIDPRGTADALDLSSLSPENDPAGARPSTNARALSKERPQGAAAPALYEELSHVRRAQTALKQGNAGLALGLMQSLDELQPRGALIAERNVTKVLALCQLGREEEATQLARAVLSKGDASVYRPRLGASCAKLGLSAKKD